MCSNGAPVPEYEQALSQYGAAQRYCRGIGPGLLRLALVPWMHMYEVS